MDRFIMDDQAADEPIYMIMDNGRVVIVSNPN